MQGRQITRTCIQCVNMLTIKQAQEKGEILKTQTKNYRRAIKEVKIKFQQIFLWFIVFSFN